MAHYVEGITHTTDRRTGAVDRIPLTDPLDWNARLNSSDTLPMEYGFPLSGFLIWIVTDDCKAVEVAYDPEAHYWTGRHVWSRQDGEPGSWEADEILGWTDDAEDAEEAAALVGKLDDRLFCDLCAEQKAASDFDRAAAKRTGFLVCTECLERHAEDAA